MKSLKLPDGVKMHTRCLMCRCSARITKRGAIARHRDANNAWCWLTRTVTTEELRRAVKDAMMAEQMAALCEAERAADARRRYAMATAARRAATNHDKKRAIARRRAAALNGVLNTLTEETTR